MIHQNSTMNSNRRTGSAFLMLVVMVLLVVVGATQTLIRSELTVRRSEGDRHRERSMLAAIQAVQQSLDDGTLDDSPEPVRLPLDASSNQYIEVSIDPDKSQFTARWTKGDKIVDQLGRRIETKVESTE